MKVRILAIFLMCFPIFAFAAPGCNFCDNEKGLRNVATLCQRIPEAKPFNFNNYKKCESLIKQCPKDGPMVNQTCERNVISENRACSQIRTVADKLETNVSAVKAKKAGKLTIFTQYFIADGQEHYYIFTPTGCLIDTAIDPRKLDSTIDKQHHNEDFLIMNWSEPRIRTNHDGSQVVTVLSKVTKSCRACEVIGWPEVNFYFTPQGMLKEVKLESFKKDWRQ